MNPKRTFANMLVLSLLLGTTPAVGEVSPTSGKSDWAVPRTEWGDPDLRGIWPLESVAQTPRQRPPEFGTRAELTDEEYQVALERARQQAELREQEDKADKLGLGHWTERGLPPLRQASLITEPKDGRIPPLTDEGARRAALTKSSNTEEVFDSLDDFNTFDRCISRGMPSSMLPGFYNTGLEVLQSPGYVAIRLELIHDTRIIPLDGRDAPPPQVTNWLGYSRGHWEGDTLVIETTNFTPGTEIGTVGSSRRPVPNSGSMKVVERLTPVGPDTIRYEAWVEDPEVLTAPFKLDFPWTRNDDYEIFEYACHEGNRAIRDYITATAPHLADEREAAWKARE